MKRAIPFLLLALVVSPSLAQQHFGLDLYFVSEPGVRFADLPEQWSFGHGIGRFDADGDGQSDLVMRRENEQGDLQDIRVVSMIDSSTPLIILEIRDVPTTLGVSPDAQLWGFADVNADGKPEIILYTDDEVRGYEEIKWTWLVGGRFVGVADFTGDGSPEVATYIGETEKLELWKQEGSTEPAN